MLFRSVISMGMGNTAAVTSVAMVISATSSMTVPMFILVAMLVMVMVMMAQVVLLVMIVRIVGMLIMKIRGAFSQGTEVVILLLTIMMVSLDLMASGICAGMRKKHGICRKVAHNGNSKQCCGMTDCHASPLSLVLQT